MDWKRLFSMQEQLDSYIKTNRQLIGKNFFEEKYLALLVEIGELANETRCFKFWSTRPRSNKEVVIAEYVDGLHFILTLGLEKGYQYEGKQLNDLAHSEIEQFNLVFSSCNVFKHAPTQVNYEKMIESYVLLGKVLGFQEEEVEAAYYKKHEINYERQNQGY